MDFETAVCAADLDLSAGPPEWIQLLPVGPIVAVDGRLWRVADAKAVIAASVAGGTDLAIDYDHQIDRSRKTGGAAPAAGWIKELAERGGFIVGRVEWTPAGAERLDNREYRFVSPVFTHAKDGTVRRILRAALTNDPAIRELKAVANANGAPYMDDLLRALTSALGLPDDTDQETALARVHQLAGHRGAGAPDPALYVPRDQVEAMIRDANAGRAGMDEERATARVEGAIRDGILPPALRDWGVSLCTAQPESFDQFLDKAVPILPNGGKAIIQGEPPRSRQADSSEAAAVCSNLGIEPDALAKNLPEGA